MSALFDREHPPRRHPPEVDADTVEIPVPGAHQPGRLRPTTRTHRIQASLLLAAYVPASLGSAWLLVLAFLRLNLPVMVVMCGALVWFVPDTVRLVRWLRRLADLAQRPRLSRLQILVASLLAAVCAYLLVDWLLHQ